MSTSRRAKSLGIRRLTLDDQELYCRLYTDSEVMRHIGEPLTHDAAERSFRRACDMQAKPWPSFWFWVVERKNESAGMIALRAESDRRLAELGAMFLPSAQGKGCATQAISLLLDDAFVTLQLDRIHTRHRTAHSAAGGLMRALGFSVVAGSDSDGVTCWQLTAESWRQRELDARAASP